MAASLKISELNALTAMADDDLFLVTDTSATTSKKVSFSTLKSNIALSATSLIGVSAGVSHLGTFSGTTILDSQTVKQALQSLETATELRATLDSPTFANHASAPEFRANGTGHLKLRAVTGNDFNLYLANEETLQITRDPSTGNPKFTAKGGTGEFKFNQLIEAAGGIKLSGTTITSWSDLVASINLDDVNTLTGVAAGGTSLGTFTGSTIADSVNIKAALQALETALSKQLTSTPMTWQPWWVLPRTFRTLEPSLVRRLLITIVLRMHFKHWKLQLSCVLLLMILAS